MYFSCKRDRETEVKALACCGSAYKTMRSRQLTLYNAVLFHSRVHICIYFCDFYSFVFPFGELQCCIMQSFSFRFLEKNKI